MRPFAQPALFPRGAADPGEARADGTRFGITPGEAWHGGRSLERADGLDRLEPGRARRAPVGAALLADLRRAATPAGALPERVDTRTGIPGSTTPLAWSHAFAILALRELWP